MARDSSRRISRAGKCSSCGPAACRPAGTRASTKRTPGACRAALRAANRCAQRPHMRCAGIRRSRPPRRVPRAGRPPEHQQPQQGACQRLVGADQCTVGRDDAQFLLDDRPMPLLRPRAAPRARAPPRGRARVAERNVVAARSSKGGSAAPRYRLDSSANGLVPRAAGDVTAAS